MLRLNNINKQFEDGKRMLTVLDNLSLVVQKGEFVAIKGESGAGKTTLLNILGTLLPPDSGNYVLDGKEVRADEVAEIRNKKIGMVFQDHRLMPQFTVMQNVLLPLLAEKNATTFDEVQRAERLLAFMDIAELKGSSVNQLSGGEKTRVAICRALINQPSVLLADEPTGQLDARNARIIAELFQKVNREMQTTIVMVTHSDEMTKAAQKTYVLRDGKVKVEEKEAP
ncbi:MAG: ABC transporter ATP-binding protein [Bacteroidaceae bacterium]|nr:ABC transporter ATP-binding protein [Bacteroidaceae bacterium]